MNSTHKRFALLILSFVFFIAVAGWKTEAIAGQLQLTWTDNSSAEDGFKIERKAGTTGTYAQIASVGPNVTSYADSNLVDGATYCYRVFAYNSSVNSPYSPEACGLVKSTVQTFSLSIIKAGTGSGTVSSNPAGINCGSTCSAIFNSGTSVTLSATAAAGSTFAGWSGTGCSTGTVTMNAGTTCTATFNTQVLQTFGLSVTKSGTGTGTVTSSPAGINCGSTCSATFNSGTSVTLSATAAAGSTFAGWSGTGCTNGSVVMDASKSCTATFNLSPQQFTLSVNVVKTVTSSGTGNGTVTSSPAGINCGSTCSALFNSGTVVILTAIPATGSTFAGWSGTGCSTGTVTMNADTTCTATFNPEVLQTFGLSVTKSGTGTGTVTSSPAGINCGSTCSATFNSGAVVTLTATPAVGSTFASWSGTGCTNGAVTMTSNIACTATFQTAANQPATRIGIFRPSTGEWFLDTNGNGQWDQGQDTYITSFGRNGDLPVIGSWSANGKSNLGTFDASTGTWQLDTNGDGVLDCTVDTCFSSFGQPGDLPVTRELSVGSASIIGTFTPRTTVMVKRRKVVKHALWNFDVNGNSKFDGCSVDECDSFDTVGELPVVGNWNGTGTEEIGVFLPDKGQWYLDLNGNGNWDGCSVDKCLGRFGTTGDLAVVGDWDGTGTMKIGVFRPSTGEWFLDLNGNGKLDSCTVDVCLGSFGQPGDLPVVGKW
jgi:List-Bact-rpt repeat protein